MSGIIMCIISLSIANFGVEYFSSVADYADAARTTWHQFIAMVIFYYLWVVPEYRKQG
jgi:hypothetical protein